MEKRISISAFNLLPYVFIYFLIYGKKKKKTWRTEEEQRRDRTHSVTFLSQVWPQ